ncbi:adenosylhomocysteinase [Nocardia terpenica]|uniref:Adenosylhomocysteinase n=1 Tax=Nocardia terpenica TaxID=455432 RepID=A0A291RPY8_9NOCA|nr:adenosylhomocysteinase [Nocardia terpenica]ATL69380.1 adenosylhomocysteinase [Nocardia terpenica]
MNDSEVCAVRDYLIADTALADAGRREIELAEREMPALLALRAEYGPVQPLAGARITGLLHMTVQTAVLIETLVALGAQVRWASSSPVSTQDHAAAAVVAGRDQGPGLPVFAWKAMTSDEFWSCAVRALTWPDGGGPNMLLDDGAGLAVLLHRGLAYERNGAAPAESGQDPLSGLLIRMLGEDPRQWQRLVSGIRGITEETTTGARELFRLSDRGELHFPALSVNDSVTKSKFDNRYGCRHSLLDGLNRATDVLIGGKLAVVCGYGDVGKGCAEALRGQGARVVVTEIDPICALQAAMDGYPVVTTEEIIASADIFVTTTGLPGVITTEHMSAMKHSAIVGNMGHSDAEIDIAGLAKIGTVQRRPVKPQVDEWVFSDGHSIIVLSEGGLLNLGNATGHPSFVMSASFANQVLGQIELYTRSEDYGPGVHRLPKLLDEKVARMHLDAVGAHLTTLTRAQAECLGVPIEGPYKPAHYRY